MIVVAGHLRGRWPALLLALAGFACGDPAVVSNRPHNIDLLERLDDADVRLTGLDDIAGPLGPAAEQNLILVDELDSGGDPRWWLEGSDDAGDRGILPITETSGESVLVLKHSDPPLSMLLRSTPHSVYRIQVRWRAEEPGRGALTVQTLPGAPARFQDQRAVRDFALRQTKALTTKIGTEVPLTAGDRWQESEALVSTMGERRSLLLRLEAAEGEVQLDRIEVRRLTTLEKFIQIVTPEPGRSALYRRLHLAAQTRESLLLPTGTTVSYSVVVPPSNPRFDSEAFVLGGAPTEVEFLVRVNGDVVGRQSARNEPGQEGEPWQVALDDHAGRRVDFELTMKGPPGYVGLLTAPRLLGAGDSRTSVVLISLDTLRADHLGSYGETRPLSPNIDRLAGEGAVFERVLSPASYTLPTHATILTGQHPLVHRVLRLGQQIDPRRSELLAVRLRAEGYSTAAFTGGGYVSPEFGFSRGFEQYSTTDPVVTEHRLAAEQKGLPHGATAGQRTSMSRALDWIERHEDQPYFLFVHTYLVHGYFPERRYLDRIGADPNLDPTKINIAGLLERAEDGDETAVETLRTLYAATVAQADDLVVKPLLEAIDGRAQAGGSTVVALVSDHGEQFLEHGQVGHGKGLWRELVSVPWILRGPGVEAGQRHEGPVELADVTPTILRLLDLPLSDSGTGRPVLSTGTSTGTSAAPHEFVLHQGSWEGLVTPQWKLLRRRQAGGPAWYLFDLDRDPGETSNLAGVQTDVLEAMRARLNLQRRGLLDRADTLDDSAPTEAVVPESLLQELRALGYTD